MDTFLLIILLLDALLLMAVVLLQAGKGGGLAAMGAAGAGSDTLFGSRQATTLLTKATWWTGGIFLALCFILSVLDARPEAAESIIGGSAAPVTAPAPSTSPALPGTLQPGQSADPAAITPEGTAAPTPAGDAPAPTGEATEPPPAE